MISAWTLEHLRAIDPAALPAPPVFTQADARPILPGLDLWDMWPLALRDGSTALVRGGTLWFALCAPRQADPLDRHGLARIRLLHQRGTHWHDGGNALPDGAAPGSREWSGSAILDPASDTVTLFFTAAGRQGEAALTFKQRLCQARGTLHHAELPSITWHAPPTVALASDGVTYHPADQRTGSPGQIKAFRDPAYFRDPADGAEYLLFAASLPHTPIPADGAIGLARAADDTLGRWALLPPLVHALGVNTELERPHALHRDGRYYLFWSTQRHTFAHHPAPHAPTGLYGMVGPHFQGPYTPLNGSGLVLANPAAEPLQAYSWWVLGDGRITSFIDYWGLAGRNPADPAIVRAQFGGVPAPFARLRLVGDRATLEGPPTK